MSESCPSLKIRLRKSETEIYCRDYCYMQGILERYDSFAEFLGSNHDDYYSFVDDSQIEDFGEFLRSNGVPYAVFREDGEVLDTWKPTCDANGDGLTKAPIIDAELAGRFRSNGYVTLADIRDTGHEQIASDLGISKIEAYDFSMSAEKVLKD